IVAGGTGFYLRALLDGLPELPCRDEALRERFTARELRRPGSMYRLLKRLDRSAAARIHQRDTQKLIRALEVRILTRSPAPAVDRTQALAGYRTLMIGLNPNREALYELLDARAREMFRSGLIE